MTTEKTPADYEAEIDELRARIQELEDELNTDCGCEEPGTACASCDPNSGYLCTRTLGHLGEHVACSMATHGLARWKGGAS
ncbi:MAG: hypothetical protein ACF8XB_01140 [Planctomycetota bacterium JB042]